MFYCCFAKVLFILIYLINDYQVIRTALIFYINVFFTLMSIWKCYILPLLGLITTIFNNTAYFPPFLRKLVLVASP